MLTNATWLFVMVNFSDGNVLVSDKLTDESQSWIYKQKVQLEVCLGNCISLASAG